MRVQWSCFQPLLFIGSHCRSFPRAIFLNQESSLCTFEYPYPSDKSVAPPFEWSWRNTNLATHGALAGNSLRASLLTSLVDDWYMIFWVVFVWQCFWGHWESAFKKNFLCIEFRETDLLFNLLTHSLVDSCMCLDWGSTPQPWHMRTDIRTLTNWATRPGQEHFLTQPT